MEYSLIAALLVIPLILQGAFMLVDEFYCHRTRGLGAWERWGHPVDTFFFGLSLAITAWLPWSIENLMVFLGVSAFSSFIITKDEWVHSLNCKFSENWLHASLFVLHPVVLGTFGILWFLEFHPLQMDQPCLRIGDFAVTCSTELIAGYRLLVIATIAAFGLYQIIYWNVWRPLKR